MSSLNDRMKNNYENRSKTYLTRRMPVIIRIDGKAFHTLTRGLNRPFDEILHEAMNYTMQYLCKNIQGCKLGYTQSDEITLLLTDYDKLDTDAWFDYAVQKICSVSASMATMAFNVKFNELTTNYLKSDAYVNHYWEETVSKYSKTLKGIIERGAMFDARCFNIPKEEVTNCFIWRQQDATRNAVQMLGQTYFSHKALDNKSISDIQDMLMLEKHINFNDMPTAFKRGVCCYKTLPVNINIDAITKEETVVQRPKWVIDDEIPIFTQDPNYVEQWV